MIAIADFNERGQLAVYHLKRFWSKALSQRGGSANQWVSEIKLDHALLDSLGLGLEPTIAYLHQQAPSFSEFEAWIKTQTNLGGRAGFIEKFNHLFDAPPAAGSADLDFLSEEELEFFDREGYIIIRAAIGKDDCAETIKVIAEYLGIDMLVPDTWYAPHSSRQGIMVQLFQHETLEKNRCSPKIRKAYECLWKKTNLWVSTDRVGFNPPETAAWKFPGPHLHLDILPQNPLPFGLQGILYLTDTKENQGALTVVPGFHKKIDQWTSQFGTGQIPLTGVFDEFGKKRIAANAGDFIIWHHGLPHGSSPNTYTQPRVVQYINLYPVK